MTDWTQQYQGGDCLLRVSSPGDWFPVWSGGEEQCPIVPKPWEAQASIKPFEDDAHYGILDVDQDGYNACCLAACANAIQFHLAIVGNRNAGVAIDVALQYLTTKGMPIVGSTERVIVTEAWDAPTWEAFASGILRGCRGVYGHFVPGGHAECGLSITAFGDLETRNSWGDNGRWHVVPASNVSKGIPYFGAFLIREVQIRQADQEGRIDAK